MLTVAPIAADLAAMALVGAPLVDPTGRCTAADVAAMCQAGQCFQVEGEGASAVYVVEVRNGVAWVSAAAGGGGVLDLTEVLDRVIVQQAAGLRRVSAQTARRGLVKKLVGRGWRVSGWIITKDLQ